MHRGEKLNLIVGLSIPSMLAQISTVMMFFIDASMVGHLGAEASASIGLIESTTWLIGSLRHHLQHPDSPHRRGHSFSPAPLVGRRR